MEETGSKLLWNNSVKLNNEIAHMLKQQETICKPNLMDSSEMGSVYIERL